MYAQCNLKIAQLPAGHLIHPADDLLLEAGPMKWEDAVETAEQWASRKLRFVELPEAHRWQAKIEYRLVAEIDEDLGPVKLSLNVGTMP